jgi:hypothetical protein
MPAKAPKAKFNRNSQLSAINENVGGLKSKYGNLF